MRHWWGITVCLSIYTLIFLTLSYIHPRANASAFSQLISDVTYKLELICPDAPVFVLGVFNHCNFKKTLRTYDQFVTCSTTQRNTILDLCYGSVINPSLYHPLVLLTTAVCISCLYTSQPSDIWSRRKEQWKSGHGTTSPPSRQALSVQCGTAFMMWVMK